MTNEIEWYIDFMREELLKLKEGKFTGHNEFRFNLKDGNTCNMNCTLYKSIKKTEEFAK